MGAQTTLESALTSIASKCSLQPHCIEDAYPCTSLQAGLLAASLHGVVDYMATFVFDLTSFTEDLENVRTGFESLYSRTPVLRTRFVDVGGVLLQIVIKESLTWCESGNLEDYLENDRKKPIVLGADVARFGWIQQDDGAVYMVWTLHHSMYDEWSLDMLCEDLSQLALNPTKTPQSLKRPPFSKFIKTFENIDSGASRSFWEDNLGKLSLCKSICANASGDSARTSQELEIPSHAKLQASCSYPVSVLATAAWSLFVSHLSGSKNVVFGNVTSGRTLPGVQNICGPTLTTVPWIIEVPHDVSLEEFLRKLQQKQSRMLPFEQAGLDEYRKKLGTARFDTLLSVRTSGTRVTDADHDYRIRPRPNERALAHPCYLVVEMSFEKDGLKVKAIYDERWVDASRLESVLQKLLVCVENLSVCENQTLKSFVESLKLPDSLERYHGSTSRGTEAAGGESNISPVDSEILNKVKLLATNLTGAQHDNHITPETSLRDMGLDSIRTVAFARMLTEKFDVTISSKQIANLQKSVSDIARLIQGTGDRKGTGDQMAKVPLLDMADKYVASLNSKLSPASTGPIDTDDRTRTILLTGATGYLGIEILRHCLKSTSCQIALLVRCKSRAEGLSRIKRSATIARWEPGELTVLEKRVRLWPSDLGAQNLALTQEDWYKLQHMNIQSIIHNGAKVNFLLAYSDLESANVGSTATLLSSALQSTFERKPSFVYVTGGRACPSGDENLTATASRLSTAAATGYSQTKIVSELLMHRAQKMSNDSNGEIVVPRMTIVHPGIIIGSGSSGVANPDDFFWRYVAASIGMGCYVSVLPKEREWINLTPVDEVASATVKEAVAENVQQADTEVHRCLMRSGLLVARFWEITVQILIDRGIQMKTVSEGEWLQEMEEDLKKRGEKHPLFSLSQLLLDGTVKGIGGPRPGSHEQLGKDNMEDVEVAVSANVKYLLDVGFLGALDEQSGSTTTETFARSTY